MLVSWKVVFRLDETIPRFGETKIGRECQPSFRLAQVQLIHIHQRTVRFRVGECSVSYTHRIHGKWYIPLHEWLIVMVNEGKYTSPTDPMGYGFCWAQKLDGSL